MWISYTLHILCDGAYKTRSQANKDFIFQVITCISCGFVVRSENAEYIKFSLLHVSKLSTIKAFIASILHENYKTSKRRK